MTDQRERVSTDPGIGPVDADNSTTLRSIEAAVEVEPDGASLYYEPLPLVAVSNHRTLEMETIKLSQDIDPRKRATELSLPRSPIPPRFDSGWPQADLVLTSSQRPAAPPRRRWRAPVLLLGVLVALLLLVLARTAMQRAADRSAASALRMETVAPRAPLVKPASAVLPVERKEGQVAGAAPPVVGAALPVASGALPIASGALPVASGALPVASGALPVASVKPTSGAAATGSSTTLSRAPAPAFAAPQHPSLKPNVAPQAAPSASDSALSAPPKPKRAIY